MKLFAILAISMFVCAVAAAEEQKENEVADAADYHVCTEHQFTLIINSLKHTLHLCRYHTLLATKRCNHRVHVLLNLINHFKATIKTSRYRIRHFIKKYYQCRRNCIWSCKRIVAFASHHVPHFHKHLHHKVGRPIIHHKVGRPVVHHKVGKKVLFHQVKGDEQSEE